MWTDGFLCNRWMLIKYNEIRQYDCINNDRLIDHKAMRCQQIEFFQRVLAETNGFDGHYILASFLNRKQPG